MAHSLHVFPVPDHPEMDPWISALNSLFDTIEAALERLEAPHDLDLHSRAIVNVTTIEGTSAARGYVRILPREATIDEAATAHRLPGVDTVSLSGLEKSLNALGTRLNEIRGILNRLHQ